MQLLYCLSHITWSKGSKPGYKANFCMPALHCSYRQPKVEDYDEQASRIGGRMAGAQYVVLDETLTTHSLALETSTTTLDTAYGTV